MNPEMANPILPLLILAGIAWATLIVSVLFFPRRKK